MAAPRVQGSGDLHDPFGKGELSKFRIRPKMDVSLNVHIVFEPSKGIRYRDGGAAARFGRVTLDNSTATVATTAVNANSLIFLTYQTEEGAPGPLTVSHITPGVSFEISGDGTANTSEVGWFIVEAI